MYLLSVGKMKCKRGIIIIIFGVLASVVFVWSISLRSSESVGHVSSGHDESLPIKAEVKNAGSSRPCRVFRGVDPYLPMIFAITPTYTRPVQKAELTRLSNTLMLVPNLHWIIVEDASAESSLIKKLVEKLDIPHTVLIQPTPADWRRKSKEPNWRKPRGVLQRNKALDWLRNTSNYPYDPSKSVVYFLDDDNAYSLEVFEEMRQIQKVGVWPVGLVGGLMVEMPIVNKTSGRVIGFNSHWRPERPFPIDMAGFAINLQLLLDHPEAKFSLTAERGYQETEILKNIITRDQLEPLAKMCTEVYVWHTRTEAPNLNAETVLQKQKKKPSNYGMEV